MLVDKDASTLPSLPRHLAEAHNMVFLSASVVSGTVLAPLLGFVPLPPAYFGFLGGATLTYLILVEGVKRRLLRRLVA